MAESSAKRKSSLSDWRTKYLKDILMCEALAALQCPFEIEDLKQRDYIPSEYTMNLEHFNVDQKIMPWTRYFTTYRGAKLAVINLYGIWFKIELCNGKWVATCPACMNLNLKHHMMEGINAKELIRTGEPLPASQAPSHAPSCASNIKTDPKRDKPMRALVGHLTETECQPP
jgi:hypothetical protein